MDTIQKVKVQNMRSPSSNKEVANQFLIYTDLGVYFQSYDTVIAFIPEDIRAYTNRQKESMGELMPKILLDKGMWDYSTTTGKYRNQFLGEDKKATERKIADGTYQLVDLNG